MRRFSTYSLPDSLAFRAYRRLKSEEEFRCNYGLNPAYQDALSAHGLRISGVDSNGEARIIELPEHPFYLGTLFLPQLSSSLEQPHPLIEAYIRATIDWRFSILNAREKLSKLFPVREA